jgi:hypothetical protein
MTSKHPQRCETCEHREIVHNHGMGTHRPRCKITKWFLDAYAPTTIEHDFIDKLGCASHSSATECPAQAVLDSAIADLEREIKDQQWMIDNYSGHHKEIHESISKALRYSLNLLRGGAHD